MKIRVNRAEFADALAAVGSVASTRTPKPILQCTLLEAHEDYCVLKATDQEISLRCVVTQVEVDRQGEVLLSADKLNQIVRESTDDILELETIDNACHVRGQSSHFQIFLQNADEYPPVPDMQGDADFTVDTPVLHKLCERTVFAAARENTRYAINGVLWEKKNDRLVMVGTDGRRLAKAEGPVKGGVESATAILPVKAIQLVLRVISDSDAAVGISFTPNQAIFRTAKATVGTSLVEGKFPDYNVVIPQDYDKQAELTTSELLSAIRQAALLTDDDSRSVKLLFREGELVLSSRSAEQGEAEVKMLAAYNDEEVAVGFNPHFLQEVLKVVGTDRVVFEVKESDKPGILRADEDFLYVVMPLSLS